MPSAGIMLLQPTTQSPCSLHHHRPLPPSLGAAPWRASSRHRMLPAVQAGSKVVFLGTPDVSAPGKIAPVLFADLPPPHTTTILSSYPPPPTHTHTCHHHYHYDPSYTPHHLCCWHASQHALPLLPHPCLRRPPQPSPPATHTAPAAGVKKTKTQPSPPATLTAPVAGAAAERCP